MTGADPETVGELSRRLTRIEQETGREIRDLRTTCAQQAAQSVGAAVYAVQRESDRQDMTDLAAKVAALEAASTKRVESLEERLRWAWRTAITGVTLPVVVGLVLLYLRGAS